MKRFAFVVVGVLALGSGACGSSTDARASGSGGAAGSSGSGGSAGAGGSVGGCVGSCDDGKNCTVDSCNAGTCTHTIGPNTGATACPTGQFCTVEKGCVAAPACATATDCTEAFKGDACKANIKCDLKTSVCLFDVLDKDGDKHPPQVCGGDDCDDEDPSIHPGAPDICDGKDDDCDGQIDDGATCSDPLQACQAGKCSCKPENACGNVCADLVNDKQHCGTCNHTCPVVAACDGGVCVCPSGTKECGPSCVDTTADTANCGDCGNTCPSGATCVGGNCACGGGTTLCGQACVDTQTDAKNCGACSNACTGSDVCEQGACGCPKCGGTTCIDFLSDESNCGACGHHCGSNPAINGCCNGSLGCGGCAAACAIKGQNCGMSQCCAGLVCGASIVCEDAPDGGS